jgi:hypothetical protein
VLIKYFKLPKNLKSLRKYYEEKYNVLVNNELMVSKNNSRGGRGGGGGGSVYDPSDPYFLQILGPKQPEKGEDIVP